MVITPQSLVLLLLGTAISVNVSDAAGNLRQVPRNLQTYTQSDDYFSAMLTRVNEERAAQGLSALCTNKKLQAAAQRHSDDQATNNYMAHDGADGSTMSQRVTDAGYVWNAVAENVAAGQVDVDAVMTAWMNSPGHRANILGDYTMFGTAYAYSADSTYKHYWTQDFGSGSTEECDGGSSVTTPKADKVANEADAPVMKTLTLEPEEEKPYPETTAPELETLAPEPETPCPETEAPELEEETPCPETTAPELETLAPEPETPCPETEAPETKTFYPETPVADSYPVSTTPSTEAPAFETNAPYTRGHGKKDCKANL
ncbi:hypothetical protein BBJ28_00022381 [Nothophytophthora sp. Chile5]|nr:hypothetical protein BBJ28_00022381 [Nothophytophthora sp. Chile5]